MKKLFLIRFRKLSLLVPAILILFIAAFPINAQKLSGLEGKWEGNAKLSLDSGDDLILNLTFALEKKEKVKVDYQGKISGLIMQSQYNSFIQMFESRPLYILKSEFSGKDKGTYLYMNNYDLISIDCAEFSISAHVKKGEIIGTITLTKDKGKGELKLKSVK